MWPWEAPPSREPGPQRLCSAFISCSADGDAIFGSFSILSLVELVMIFLAATVSKYSLVIKSSVMTFHNDEKK